MFWITDLELTPKSKYAHLNCRSQILIILKENQKVRENLIATTKLKVLTSKV